MGAAEEPVVLVRVTETESMATVYLRPHSPRFVRGGHTYTRSTGQCAQHQHEEVWRARQRRGIEGRRVGCGRVWGG